MRQNIGFWATILYFCVTFSQLHTIIPGIKFLRPGLITTIIVVLTVIPDLTKINYRNPIILFRIFFCLAIIPGMIDGYALGSSRAVFQSSLLGLICSFLAPLLFCNNYKRLEIYKKIILLTALIVSVWTITHRGHGPGILSDENDAALVLVMLLPFPFFFSQDLNKTSAKVYLYILLGLILVAIASTLSRGGMVGTLPTLLYIWIKSKQKFGILFLFVLLIVISIAIAPPVLIREFLSISNTTGGTAGERRYFWDLSWQMFLKRPLWGVGAQAWGNAVWSGIIDLPRHVRNSTPHSVYFQLISEMGILGVITWSGLIISTFKILYSINRDAKFSLQSEFSNQAWMIEKFSNALAIGLFGGLICGVFLSFLFYPYMYTYCGFTVMIQNLWKDYLNEKSLEVTVEAEPVQG